MKIKALSVLIIFAGMTSACGQNRAKGITAPGGFEQTPVSNVAYAGRTVAVGPDFTVAAENTVNAVVHVMTKTEPKVSDRRRGGGGNMPDDPFYNFFFGIPDMPQRMEPQMASGSGVIISTDGYIVTNNHVVSGSDNIQVVLNDKRTFTATVVGTDPSTDLALLKIDAKDLSTVVFGNSDDLKIGEWVLAVGNPFNLTSTVTAGIVSAKARNINIIESDMRVESFIQTDAAINPGNSGGALVNVKGELVGINTAIASRTGTYAGYGFAIPVSIVSKVVADLKEYGAVQRAVIGVKIQDIDNDLAKEKNLKTLEGAYVNDVTDRSAAMDAGIKVGDVITKVNDVSVKSVSELQEQISRFRPGDKVNITYNRDGNEKTVNVTLRNGQGNMKVVKNSGLEALGASFEEVNDNLKQQLRISGGLQIVSLQKNSALAKAGIQKGFIILKIDGQSVRSISDLESIIKANNNSNDMDRGLYIVGIYPNGKVAYYAVDPNAPE